MAEPILLGAFTWRANGPFTLGNSTIATLFPIENGIKEIVIHTHAAALRLSHRGTGGQVIATDYVLIPANSAYSVPIEAETAGVARLARVFLAGDTENAALVSISANASELGN